jgi:hypothetical protein
MTSQKKRTEKQKRDFITSLGEEPSERVTFELATEPTPDDDDWLDNDLEEVARDEVVGDKSDVVSMHPFQPGHELYKTHYIRCDRRDLENVAPNFVGGALQCMDQGDCEYYCMTMSTLFKPWRSGNELKAEIDNWDETFRDYRSSPKALQKMKYFNIKYECNDARDDYSSLDTKAQKEMPPFSRYMVDNENDNFGGNNYEDYGEDADFTSPEGPSKGKKWLALEEKMSEAEKVMQRAGWTQRKTIFGLDRTRFVPDLKLKGSQWKTKVSLAKDATLEAKVKNVPESVKSKRNTKESDSTGQVLLLDSFYFTKYFKAKEKKAMRVVDSVVTDFKLNGEQERAFRLVANHVIAEDPDQLNMHLGGVGGTGKSQVIRVLISLKC